MVVTSGEPASAYFAFALHDGNIYFTDFRYEYAYLFAHPTKLTDECHCILIAV